ncbi:integral membrane protein (macronuclear) [Tetrahymena thermophila SB210]|uniref:Integral membrane protein n=1 Tax=Tetrahymena thermophila (strain SB210) TaxID=312017 RepID=Q22DU8_TETTS|nr:integral membrane protein [Tetrahymena thermophila SB210]EAR83457.2 integral membrane protein [Tetrahymena thermophila SB210]|eukprot:XP_001031120.2 integral membrane protein [Tetrahymena thermophila SB210]
MQIKNFNQNTNTNEDNNIQNSEIAQIVEVSQGSENVQPTEDNYQVNNQPLIIQQNEMNGIFHNILPLNNQENWIKIQMIDQLELLPEEKVFIKSTIVILLGFAFLVLIYLLCAIFIGTAQNQTSDSLIYTLTGVFSALFLLLGYSKQIFNSSICIWYKSILETLFIGIEPQNLPNLW